MRQGQSLVMTPQLSQSIKLLTLSNIELSAFVEAEIEKNPVLEAAPSQPLTDRTGQSDHPTVETIGELTNQTELETSAKSLSENLGTSLENVYPDEQDYRSPATDNAKTKEEYDSRISTGGLQLSSAVSAHDQTVADYTAARETLQDTLMGQLAISGTSITHSKIATDIIDNLDPAGYQRPFAASAGVSGALHRPECVLLLDDLAGHFQNCLGALVQTLGQPVGGLKAI